MTNPPIDAYHAQPEYVDLLERFRASGAFSIGPMPARSARRLKAGMDRWRATLYGYMKTDPALADTYSALRGITIYLRLAGPDSYCDFEEDPSVLAMRLLNDASSAR